ncbi:Ger(x)C family spore germination protein [Candidatus Clostridium radicumherbarum]|uniref:Ger(X)C family spore germination protein n=1 Tax=Candidatus Clostridium radicumherbarum TaxID=3381662 RepID=A0ABW8TVJ8_9CLOT
MSKFKRNLLIIFIIIISTTFIGCWNYREINEMAIVTACSIDKNYSNNKYIVSLEVIRAIHGERGGTISSKIYQNQGDTLFETVRNTISTIGRKAYWGHNEVVIISKSIAESDLSPVLDWLFRDQEPRLDMNVLISKDTTAEDILKLSPSLDNIVGLDISKTISNQKNNNRFPKAEVSDVVGNFTKEERIILIPLAGRQIGVSDNITIEGSAILKREKVVGYLSAEDTFNALWLQGKVKTGTFVIKNLIKPNADATIEIFNSKTKTKFINTNNKKEIMVNIKADVSLAELSDNIPFQKKEDMEKLKEGIRKSIEERLTNTIKKVQVENKTDVFNFYNKVRIYDKNYYKKVSSNWGEEFSSIPVIVKADVYIRGSAMASKNIKGEK